jgi:hypothetical protein
MRGRLAFAPVVVEVGDAGEFGERVFVDPFAAGRGARLLREDGELCVA